MSCTRRAKLPSPAPPSTIVQRAGRPSLTLTVQRGEQAHDVQVPIEPLGFAAWLCLCGGFLILAWIWLLTVALDLFLAGRGDQVWQQAVVSAGIFAGGLLVLWLLRRRPRMTRH